MTELYLGEIDSTIRHASDEVPAEDNHQDASSRLQNEAYYELRKGITRACADEVPMSERSFNLIAGAVIGAVVGGGFGGVAGFVAGGIYTRYQISECENEKLSQALLAQDLIS